MNFKDKQLNTIILKENNFINKKSIELFSSNSNNISKFVEQKIPKKAFIVAEATFETSFDLIFDDGNKILEKTYSKDKILAEYEKRKNKFNSCPKNSNLKYFDKSIKFSNKINTTLTGLKSTALGILGIGMPDIPVFIAEIIRVVYQTALKYGYNYDSDLEKMFILSIIGFSLGDIEEKKYYSDLCDRIASSIFENSNDLDLDLKDIKSKISKIMVKKICSVKFIQGMFVIGIFSSISNMSIINNISVASYIKYKKRFLMYKISQIKE